MVIICSAPGCSTKKDAVTTKTSVLFHRFPLRKPDVLSKWVKAMKNPNFKPTVTSYLCEAHFTPSDYEIKANTGKHLKSTAIPTVFEKRRPGRKKKLVNDHEVTEVKENLGDNAIKVEPREPAEEEYLEDGLDNKTSNLADIIEDQGKDGLQILVVGEDGKITNYQYVFKKELMSDEELKQDLEPTSYEECRETDEENESTSKGNSYERDEEAPEDISLLKYRDLKYRAKIKSLEANLLQCRKKVKILQSKYRKTNRKLNTLKILLKLLVLKKGKGEKSIKELLEDYEKQVRTFVVQLNSEVSEENDETEF